MTTSVCNIPGCILTLFDIATTLAGHILFRHNVINLKIIKHNAHKQKICGCVMIIEVKVKRTWLCDHSYLGLVHDIKLTLIAVCKLNSSISNQF